MIEIINQAFSELTYVNKSLNLPCIVGVLFVYSTYILIFEACQNMEPCLIKRKQNEKNIYS